VSARRVVISRHRGANSAALPSRSRT
jgi:hypothetical protein